MNHKQQFSQNENEYSLLVIFLSHYRHIVREGMSKRFGTEHPDSGSKVRINLAVYKLFLKTVILSVLLANRNVINIFLSISVPSDRIH